MPPPPATAPSAPEELPEDESTGSGPNPKNRPIRLRYHEREALRAQGKLPPPPEEDPEPPPSSDDEPDLISPEAQAKIEAILEEAVRNPFTMSAKDDPNSTFSRYIRGTNDRIGQHFERDTAGQPEEPDARPASTELTAAAAAAAAAATAPTAQDSSQNEQPAASSTQPNEQPAPPSQPHPDEPAPPAPYRSVAHVLGEAILRYGTPGQPEYDPLYDPDNPEYAHLSSKRRRNIVKRNLVQEGLLDAGMPELDPEFWRANIDPDENPSRKGRQEPYPPGTDRKGMGNPYGARAYSEHPDGLCLFQTWLEFFTYNFEAAPHNKLSDEDLAFMITQMFPRNRPRTVRDIGAQRSLFNAGLMRGAEGNTRKLERYGRELFDLEQPHKGYEVFTLTSKGRPIQCLTCPEIRIVRGHRCKLPPKPSKLRRDYPFPQQAPYWFRWWEGKIVSPDAFDRLKYAKDRFEWETAHPGEKYELEPFEDDNAA